jgi:hypothetical protein
MGEGAAKMNEPSNSTPEESEPISEESEPPSLTPEDKRPQIPKESASLLGDLVLTPGAETGPIAGPGGTADAEEKPDVPPVVVTITPADIAEESGLQLDLEELS